VPKDDLLFFKEQRLLEVFKSKNIPNVSTLVGVGKIDDVKKCLYLQRFGRRLSDEQERRGKLSFKTSHQIGLQLLKVLELVHSTGYCHGNLEPSNIMIGTSDEPNSSTVNLIGFSRAQEFIKEPMVFEQEIKEDYHIEEGYRVFTGNKLFASPFSLNNKKQSRRDDLYSLVYLLIYLQTG
jgi:serine/threonine protein kinase